MEKGTFVTHEGSTAPCLPPPHTGEVPVRENMPSVHIPGPLSPFCSLPVPFRKHQASRLSRTFVQTLSVPSWPGGISQVNPAPPS